MKPPGEPLEIFGSLAGSNTQILLIRLWHLCDIKLWASVICQWGLLQISVEGVKQRDEIVWRAALNEKIPICMCLSGGTTFWSHWFCLSYQFPLSKSEILGGVSKSSRLEMHGLEGHLAKHLSSKSVLGSPRSWYYKRNLIYSLLMLSIQMWVLEDWQNRSFWQPFLFNATQYDIKPYSVPVPIK